MKQPPIPQRRSSEPDERKVEQMLLRASPMFRLFMLIAIKTGLRREENILLRWDWIDWDAAVIHLPANAAKGRKRPRTIPLATVVVDELRARWKDRLASSPYVYVHASPGKRQGKRYSLQWASNTWAELAREVGLTPSGADRSVRLHDSRAKSLNDGLRGGAPLGALMQTHGWESLQSVQRYIRVNDEDLDRVRRAMDHGALVFKRRPPTRAPVVGSGEAGSPNTDKSDEQ